jgi:hypothetical protein
MSAAASCSASATSTTVIVDGCKPGDLTCVITNDASILKFKASPSIVNQGAQCKFEWQTTGMSICSLKINGSSVAVPGNGTAATGVVAETADGNNKNGLLTCTTSGIPVRTVTATSTCRVNPEFRQQ